MNPIDVYFGEYKTLAGNGKRLADANKALNFLEKQFKETNSNVFGEFHEKWLGDELMPEQPLLFVNVAKFYEPLKYPHQLQALKFLNGYLSPGTREEFDRLWFDKPLKS